MQKNNMLCVVDVMFSYGVLDNFCNDCFHAFYASVDTEPFFVAGAKSLLLFCHC